ncbi:MAG: hypothetical protein V3U71_09180 [Cocleimonas sp.]
MQDSLITYEQLREVFGGSSTAEVVVRLESQDIPYKLGKRGCPITTFSALNHAMGITSNESPIIKEHTPTIEIE